LPDVLDLLTVSVEAGLGFDQAVVKVIEKFKGPLAEEFHRTLQEVRMNKPRREALRALADRVGIDDLTAFIAALIQADQLGVSIAKVLRIQSDQMRIKRRQRAEEQAQKASIKMLFPLIFFIFPAMFIVLLGPAVLSMMGMK
jgi:tight adherence protein C